MRALFCFDGDLIKAAPFVPETRLSRHQLLPDTGHDNRRGRASQRVVHGGCGCCWVEPIDAWAENRSIPTQANRFIQHLLDQSIINSRTYPEEGTIEGHQPQSRLEGSPTLLLPDKASLLLLSLPLAIVVGRGGPELRHAGSMCPPSQLDGAVQGLGGRRGYPWLRPSLSLLRRR